MRRVCAAMALVAALVCASPAAAQRTTGEIIGKVVDESGGVLPGVSVTLHGAGVAGAPTVVTSEAGTYRFPVLPPGTYAVDYELAGFSMLKREGIVIAVGATIELDQTLKVSSLNESITVQGGAPVVNVVSTEVSTTYNREWVQNAPVRRFSYFDLINSAPGVSANSNVGQSTAAQSLGSSTNENSYQVDGTDISSTPWLNTDAIEEVQVMSTGASAEYGNVQGAVFNIVTRQGGNAFHGDGNVYFQNDALTGRNTTDAVDKGFPYHRDTWRDATVQASGPFVMDKFWFFGSLQYQRDYDSQPGVDPNSPVRNDTRRVFWKFNYNLNASHRLMHGYHDDYYWIPGSQTAFTAPSSIDMSHGDNPTPNVVYTGVLSDKTFIEARYSGFWLKSSTDPNQEGTARVQTRFVDNDTGLITGGIESWTENRSWRYGLQAKLSHLTENFLGGSHDLKVGFQYGGHGSDNLNGPNDIITTNSGIKTGTTQLPYHQGALVRWSGVYIDDSYRLGRTVFNLGVRYDHSQGSYPSFPLLDASGFPTGAMSQATDDVIQWDTFSPRLGMTYRVNSSGKTIVKAHYGRYYRAMDAGEFRPAVPSISPGYEFGLDAAGNRVNLVQVSSNANLRIDPDMKAPYNNQYIVQVEQELLNNLGLQVSYVHKDGADYSGWTDIAGVYDQVPYVDNRGVDATGQTVMVYRLMSSPASRLFQMNNLDGLETHYNGVTMQATKRMSNRWQAVFSLVLSKAEGRLPSSARFTPATQQSSNAGSAPTSASPFGRQAAGPNDFVNTEGLLIGDRPVVSKVQLMYSLPWGIMASGNFQHQTGRLYSRQVAVSGLGFPANVTINMEANTGDRRVDDVDIVDMRVQKEFAFSPVRVGVFLDALNLTNSDQAESIASAIGTNSAFGVPTKYIPPRRLQIGAKLRW
jgi:Carboxypeptidase regulatory-like domain/TonB-dependent Receptor Plug Domain